MSNTPDYEKEFEIARSIAMSAIENIDFMTVVEKVPEGLESEEVLTRIHRMAMNFDPEVSALSELSYKRDGTIR